MNALRSLIAALMLCALMTLIEVEACFDPMDRYSVEVVLNKPGIYVDLEKLRSLENVVQKGSDLFVDTSFVSEGIVVILSFEPVKPGGEKYFALRIQPIAKSVKILLARVLGKTKISIDSETLRMWRERLVSIGWNASVEDGKNFATLKAVKSFDNASCMLSITNISNLVSISLVCRSTTLGRDELSNLVLDVANNLSSVLPISFDRRVALMVPEVVWIPISKVSVVDVLRQELTKLVENNVVKGLTKQDIETLMKVARVGYAGWNERIVYFNGSWHPFSKVAEALGSYLVKEGLCAEPKITLSGNVVYMDGQILARITNESTATPTTIRTNSTTTTRPTSTATLPLSTTVPIASNVCLPNEPCGPTESMSSGAGEGKGSNVLLVVLPIVVVIALISAFVALKKRSTSS